MKTNKPPKSKKGSDIFQTPLGTFDNVLQYVPKDYIIWEPACGKGNIVKDLTQHGYKVIGTDIEDEYDFFTYQPKQFDIVITNPPYSIKDKWIKRCYELNKPFILLLPLTALEGIKRQELYRQYGVSVMLFNKRINYETPSGKGSGAWFPSCLLSWGLNLPSNLMFI